MSMQCIFFAIAHPLAIPCGSSSRAKAKKGDSVSRFSPHSERMCYSSSTSRRRRWARRIHSGNEIVLVTQS